MKRLLFRAVWKIVTALFVPALLYVAVSLYLGLRVEQVYRDRIESLSTERAIILDDTYQRGWFGSSAVTVIEYPLPATGDSDDTLSVSLHINSRIQHGPLVFDDGAPHMLLAGGESEISARLRRDAVEGVRDTAPLPDFDIPRLVAHYDIALFGALNISFSTDPASAPLPGDFPGAVNGSLRADDEQLDGTFTMVGGVLNYGGLLLDIGDIELVFSHQSDEASHLGNWIGNERLTIDHLRLEGNGVRLLSVEGGGLSFGTTLENGHRRQRVQLRADDLMLDQFHPGAINLRCDLHGINNDAFARLVRDLVAPTPTRSPGRDGADFDPAQALVELIAAGAVTVHVDGNSELDGEYLHFDLDGTLSVESAMDAGADSAIDAAGMALRVIFSENYIKRLSRDSDLFILHAFSYGNVQRKLLERNYLRRGEEGLELELVWRDDGWVLADGREIEFPEY